MPYKIKCWAKDGDGRVIWTVKPEPHLPYWQEQELASALFYDFRDAWIQGFLAGKNVVYARLGEHIFQVSEE